MLGLHMPRPRPDFAEVHGPLMVLGFLGTLIALERAVPLDEPVGYLAPAAAGLGGVALTVWRAMVTRGMADVLQHHPQQRPVPTDSPASGFSALKP